MENSQKISNLIQSVRLINELLGNLDDNPKVQRELANIAQHIDKIIDQLEVK